MKRINQYLGGLILCGLTVAGPARADMSGTYVGKGPNIAVLVQFVETSGGNLTGRYEQVVLQTDGKVEDMNATIAGARNGETVVATLKTADFFAAAIPVSGTFQGGVLHLTGGANSVLNLEKGDEADFRTQVATLNRRAGEIRDARAEAEANARQEKLEADRLSRLQNLTGRISAFSARADTSLPKFAPVEQQYRTITGRMRGGLARERSIYGGGQAGVARGQLSVAINQLAIEANQIHINTHGSYQQFDFNSRQLTREAAEANGWCQGTVPVSLIGACQQFSDAQKNFARHVMALRAAYSQLEAVWTSERRDQDAIVQWAQGAVQ
jgi:hypothetical protein